MRSVPLAPGISRAAARTLKDSERFDSERGVASPAEVDADEICRAGGGGSAGFPPAVLLHTCSRIHGRIASHRSPFCPVSIKKR